MRPGSGKDSGLSFCFLGGWVLFDPCVCVGWVLLDPTREVCYDRRSIASGVGILMTTKGSRRRIPNRVFGPRRSYSRDPYSRVACPVCQKRMGVNRIAIHMRTCVPCSTCEGVGRISVEGRAFPLECRACRGTGKESSCPECGGPFPCRVGCPSRWKPIPVVKRTKPLA
jgi:hypothetical protein